MPPSVALCLVGLLILWLFAKDMRQRPTVSAAIWIPLTWAFIVSTRPVSFWLASGPEVAAADGYIQDKPIDKGLFLLLIGAAMFVLARRRTNWRVVFRQNRWLFLYFGYLGLSVLWSEDSFVSFKRWIKDFGNVFMVLIILTEKSPVEASRALLFRYASLMLPLTLVGIKYFPQLTRSYEPWTNRPGIVGLTTDKNTLGMTAFVCGLSLVWMLHGLWRDKRLRKDRTVALGCSALLLMAGWLLLKAHSATALVCTLLGAGIVVGLGVRAIRNQAKHLWAYAAAAGVLVCTLQATGCWSLVVGGLAEAVGRDPTLHGRAGIWERVLGEDINPLVGVGFYSFWSEERNRRLSEEFYYSLGTAHNGYIETYLNSGLIGVALLLIMFAAAIKATRRDLLSGSDFAPLRLAFIVTIVLYNFSESTFDRLVPVWFITVLVVGEYPRLVGAQPRSVRGIPADPPSVRPLPPVACS